MAASPPLITGKNPRDPWLSRYNHFCLQVEPFDGEAIIAHLKQHGCEPGPIESRYGAKGQGPSIYVPDPEGNMVELKGPPWES